MTIVVTGAGGFVGRHLVQRLLASGTDVAGIDTFADSIPEGARIIAGDFGDAAVRAEALAGGCEALVHLATVPGGAA
jgi:nucleoside-diphosphate-sugar epimerase